MLTQLPTDMQRRIIGTDPDRLRLLALACRRTHRAFGPLANEYAANRTQAVAALRGVLGALCRVRRGHVPGADVRVTRVDDDTWCILDSSAADAVPVVAHVGLEQPCGVRFRVDVDIPYGFGPGRMMRRPFGVTMERSDTALVVRPRSQTAGMLSLRYYVRTPAGPFLRVGSVGYRAGVVRALEGMRVY